MNRIIITLASALATATLWAAPADTIAIVARATSWQAPLPNGGRIECTMQTQTPADPTVEPSFNTWMAQAMAHVMPAGITAGTTMYSAIEAAFMQEGNAVASALKARKKAADKPVSLALDITQRRSWETARVITFRLNAVHYDSAGVRNEQLISRTFFKATGKTLTWSDVVLPKRQGKFCKAVAEAMMGFFGVRDWDNLKSRLSIAGTAPAATLQATEFPLPQNGPAFEANGILLTYEPGEIAPAAMGRPSALIPYSCVSGSMTPFAKSIIK